MSSVPMPMSLPPKVTRVSLSRLLDDHTPIRVEEAIAIVRKMWDLRQISPLQGEIARRAFSPRLPGLDELKLNMLGELSVHRLARARTVSPAGQEHGHQSGHSPTPVMVLGQALQILLDRGGAAASNPPWKLWSIVELAAVPWSFGDSSAPQEAEAGSESVQTGDAFLKGVEPFGPTDDKEALRQLFFRWEADRAVEQSRPTAWSLAGAAAAPWRTPLSDTLQAPAGAADAPFDPIVGDLPPAVFTTRAASSSLPDRQTQTSHGDHPLNVLPVGASALETQPAIAAGRAEGLTLGTRGRAISRRTLAAVAAFIAIACLSYAATLALLRAATPPGGASSPSAERPVDTPSVLAGTDADQTADALGRDEEGAVSPGAARRGSPFRSTSTASGDETDETAVVPQPAVFTSPVAGQTNDLRPLIPTFDGASMYSPSFMSNGDLLFHTGARDQGDLMRASASDIGFDVSTLLNDGHRNYHAQVSPDGTQIAFDSDRHGERGVYVALSDGSNPRRISGDGHAVIPTWSPDGTRLAFARAEPGGPRVWNIWIADVRSGAIKRLTSHQSGQPWGASWFPDDERIAYSRADRLIVLNTRSGETETFRSPRAGGWIRTPAVSPEGGRVVFQLFGDGAWLLNLQDRSMRRMLADRSAEEFAWTPDGQQVAFHSRRSGTYRLWVMSADGG